MEEKYGLKFSELQKKAEENFQAWDDLILWEGYEIAYREWIKKYNKI